MRTSREIANWLKKQVWYDRFKANTASVMGKHCMFYKDIVRGRNGEMTIAGAFNWPDTKEGYYFWSEVNIVFLQWLGGSDNELLKK